MLGLITAASDSFQAICIQMNGQDSLHADIRPHAPCLKLHMRHRRTEAALISADCLRRKLFVAHCDHAFMDEIALENFTATEKLIASESRYTGRHVDMLKTLNWMSANFTRDGQTRLTGTLNQTQEKLLTIPADNG